MTRKSVYGTALVAFLATCALTLAAVIIPRWISWDVSSASGAPVHYTYGLHARCSSLTGGCAYFPQAQDCHGGERAFCSAWRSVGFLMSLAVVLEGMALIAFVVVLLGGRQKRAHGWRVVSALLAVVAVVQCAAMAIMAYLYNTDDRFFKGWRLDQSWAMCTAGWSIQILIAAGLAGSALLLPPEAGYELIPDERRRDHIREH